MNKVSSRKMIRILFNKEMKDIFRDRKSVLMMFFVPVVLYPLIFLVAFFILSMMQTGVSTQVYHIALDGMPDSRMESRLNEIQKKDNKEKKTYEIMYFNKDDFDAITKAWNEFDKDNKKNKKTEESSESITVKKDGLGEKDTALKDSSIDLQKLNIARALKEESIQVYVRYENKDYHIYYNSSITNSMQTARLVESALGDVKHDLVVENLKDKGLDADAILNPIKVDDTDTATSEQSLGYFLGTIIPFMMIISLLVGVFTPAIDATSGEKERGTLETLLMMPVTNSQIIVAKFFSVALIGLITTLLSIASMAGLGAYILNLVSNSGVVDVGGIDIGSFLPAILITVPVLIVLSLFLTAISMCVTCFAKTYKEANMYMSPVMIVVMLTGYIGFIPNLEFDKTMAMIPVANVCLLIKNLLLFKVNMELVMIVIVSTAAYTGLVILALGKMYHSEAILFDEGRNGLALLERRSNMKRGGVPSSGDAWFVVLVGFLLLVYAGGLLQTHYGLNGVAASQIVLAAFPLLMAVYTRKNVRKTFNLKKPKVGTGTARAWTGSLIMGFGMILLGIVISDIMAEVFPTEGQAFYSTIENMFSGSALWVWAVVSVFPAICEELLFRGYILSGFRSRYPEWATVLAVGVCFGVFHTSVMRFPGTCLLGMAFAFIVCRTGSIIPGMILHCLNNSLAIISMYAPGFVDKYMPFAGENMSGTAMAMYAGIAVVMCVIGVILLSDKKKNA